MAIDPDQALTQVEAADRRWRAAVEALEGSVARLREFGEAAREEATALRLADGAGVRWSGRPGASRMQLPYDLRAESGLRAPRAPWDGLDEAWAELGEALEGDELFEVSHAFDAVAVAARAIVKVLEGATEDEVRRRSSRAG